VPVIDFRFRPPTEELKANHREFEAIIGMQGAESWYNTSLEECVREMEEADLIGVVLGRAVPPPKVSNDHLKELADRYPGRFIPLAGVDPGNTSACRAEIERTVKGFGFPGIHFDPGLLDTPLSPDDRRLYPVYEQCAGLDAVVCLSLSLKNLRPSGNISFVNPLSLEAVARDFPGLQLVMAHGAYPFFAEIVSLMTRYPNVWISPDVYHFRPLGGQYAEIFSVPPFSERYLYGSAYPYGWYLRGGLSMKQTVAKWKELSWKTGETEKLLYGNAARLLKLKPEREGP